MKISAVIITYNEEQNIARCLQSVAGIADEIVVVDSLSTDGTVDIAKRYQARVISQPFRGYIAQKNDATSLAQHDWILSLDADEVLSSELAASILKIKQTTPVADYYQCSRMANYCGAWIRHGGWYPDRKIRLFNRSKGEWQGHNNLHERWQPYEANNTAHKLKGDLLHYTFNNISEHLRQIDRFTDIMAQTLAAQGKNASMVKIIVSPVWRFINDYVLHLGFLDGYPGYLVCKYSAFATQVKYSKLKQYATAAQKKSQTDLPALQNTV